MNRTRLKNYAPAARREFIQAMTDRAAFYGLTATKIEPVVERGDVAVILGRELPLAVSKKRQKLAERIKLEGFDHTIEALAYTWFNRLVAIRYMELRGYLDHGYRVLSHPEGKPTPEILQHAEHVDLPGLNRETVIDLKLDGNKDAELYRMLVVAQCNALNRAMPFLFERIDDETELLLPDNLLHSDSLVRALVRDLETEDCESVEVLGWLYQFYISERKDQVMARKSAVPTDDIPAVTQLFTPHWIVRYLVENSLGRLWLLNHPNSGLRAHMPYYIEGEVETDFAKVTKPEDIRVCDPAVGSGHMLTYAFDLLALIYEEEGYAPAEIPALILQHNLYGLEICPRAAQLAGLALVFKGREKSRRFLQAEHLVEPHIIELRDIAFDDNELRDYIGALGLGDLFTEPVLALFRQFQESKNFGSLIQPCIDEQTIAFVRRAIEAKGLGGQLFLHETHVRVLRVLEQAEALTQRYHAVVANPPYMGNGQMNRSLANFVASTLSEGRADMYAAFILRNLAFAMRGGRVGMITIPNWMFLSSFEELRGKLLDSSAVSSLIHCGRGIWGSDFGSCAFILSKTRSLTGRGEFRRLFQRTGEVQSVQEIEANFFDRKTYRPYLVAPEDFRKITGSPFAYWVGKYDIFDLPLLSDRVVSGGRIKTHDGPRFIRFHWEVPRGSHRWRLFLKGGEFRKFYGNELYVVDWSDQAVAFYGEHGGLIRDEFRAKEGLCWSKITVSLPSFRLKRQESEYDSASPTIFTRDFSCDFELLGYLNSRVGSHVLGALNPTVNTQVADVLALPFAELKTDSKRVVVAQTREAVSVARVDWDNFETSWDFRDQPLLRLGLKGATLEASWKNWERQCTAAIRRMQELETENNRLFIAAYGLDGELQPDVPEAQITLARAEARRDVAAFLSYAVGCMMGRYSVDHTGLVLANAGDTVREFLDKVGRLQDQLTFVPDEDGIIPVLDAEWFADDVVARTHEFLRATFGDATLQENLRFIEESLGKDLRKYFLADFYKDHLQAFKKRPIHWLFSSGKQRAFQCLVYLHRYHEGTLARMRTEYVIPLQGLLAARIEQLEGDKATATSTSHRKKLQREQDVLKKQLPELLAFEEKLKHVADQKIGLDLDDGVKVNYGKFGDLLAESKSVTGGTDDE